jgi:hypothetical protein
MSANANNGDESSVESEAPEISKKPDDKNEYLETVKRYYKNLFLVATKTKIKREKRRNKKAAKNEPLTEEEIFIPVDKVDTTYSNDDDFENCKFVPFYYLHKLKEPSRNEVHKMLAYRGLDHKQVNFDNLFNEMKRDTVEAKCLAKEIIHKMLNLHANAEGIRTEEGSEIITNTQFLDSFEQCKDKEAVRKYVNVCILKFDTYKKWKTDIRNAILMEMGWYLDSYDIVKNKKRKDCFYRLASQMLLESIKNLNRRGRMSHGLSISKSKPEELIEDEFGNKTPARTKTVFYDWMIRGELVSIVLC